MFIFFQDKNTAAFAQYQAVAPAIVGRGGRLRSIVFTAGGIQRVKNIGFGGTKFPASARQHHRNPAEFDRFISKTYTLTAGGACAGRGDNPAAQSKMNGNIGSGSVRHHAHVSIGIKTITASGHQQFANIADIGSRADRRTAGNAHAPITDSGIIVQTRIR